MADQKAGPKSGMGSGAGQPRPMRVAVIEDDSWKRSAMAEHLHAHRLVEVVHALDQDEAAAWGHDRWGDVDTALVDVWDDNAPGEVGTDLYSGISAIEQLRGTHVKVLAILPHLPHPVVQLRLHQSGAHWAYRRWELATTDDVVTALHWSRPERGPVRPPASELARFGIASGRPNDAVRAYIASELGGRLRPEMSHKQLLPIKRAEIDALKKAISATGLRPTGDLADPRGVPRWPEVRDYVLRALGRLDAPPTDHDQPWLYT